LRSEGVEMSLNKKPKLTREGVLAIIVAAFIIFLSTTTNFSSRSGIYSFMLDVSPTMVAAIGLSMLIFTGILIFPPVRSAVSWPTPPVPW
jgi:ribose/xylose/arabinose/galactoside ABC-type transport system permease subunit